jgi:pantothenate kinase-related protein Tda10
VIRIERIPNIIQQMQPEMFDIKKRPLFIGVTGGTAGGKTSICDM